MLRTRWHPAGLVSLLGQQLGHPDSGGILQPLAFDFRPHTRLELHYPVSLREPMAAVRGTAIWQRYIRRHTFLLATQDPQLVMSVLNRPEAPTAAIQSFHAWRAPPVLFQSIPHRAWIITSITPPPPRTRLDRWRDHLNDFPGLALCTQIFAPRAGMLEGPPI